MGGNEAGSELTQQTATGDDTQSAPAAGETDQPKGREEGFRALMEGEYKDLFTAYFQETFNRRFREQKEIKEELDRTKALVDAAAKHFGVETDGLLTAIRAEDERKNAPTASANVRPAANPTARSETEKDGTIEAAVANARRETEQALLATIRARGLRPAENALDAKSGTALGAEAGRLSRAGRAELARRAAEGEQIKL